MNNTKATMPFTFDSIFKQRRIALPKRTSNLVALIALSTTLFLFLHTRDLNTKLRRMEGRLSSSADASSYNQLTGDHSGSASGRHSERMLKSAQEQKEHDRLNEVDSRLPEEHIQEEQKYEDDTPSPRQLNNTLRANIEVIFFNRVPKVGSQTFMELLRRLAMRNEFTFVRDAVQRVETIRLAPREQRALVDMVSTLQTPAAYVKHVCYTNFSMYGYPEPIYINVVRDPIERVISWYYYVRAPWYYVERKRAFPDLPLPDPQWLKKDFESCVMNGDRECRYQQGETHEGIGDHRRQTLFFCGHEEECTPFNTNGALERAKRAVEERYAVVGVLEDMNATLSAFEHYVPRFFAGASSVYWDELNRINKINRNAFKPPVSEAVKDIVRANFTMEIEFYQFCRQRLYRQLRALRLPHS